MKFYVIIILLIFGFVQNQDRCNEVKNKKSAAKANSAMNAENKVSKFDHLPEGVTLTSEVREEIKDEKGEISYQIITVGEKLKDLGAVADGEKLVDRDGREIRFYSPPLRGASQGFEEDQRQHKLDAKVLRELMKKYTVIVLYVNPLKVM